MTPLGLGGDRGTSQDDTLADLGGDKRPRAASASLMTVLLVLLIAVGAAAYIAATGSDESNDDYVEHDSDSADVEVVADLGNASLELDEIDLVTAVDQGMAEQDRRAGAFQLNIGEADRRVATAHSRATHTAADSADESHNSDPTPAISSAAAAVAQARVAAQAAQPEQTVAVIYVQGTPSSAEVRLGRRRVCRNLRSRCRVELPLGDERHRITVTADDYRDHSFRVDRSDDGDTYRVSLTLDI